MKILAFDIGIKNLAWALLNRSGNEIIGLANDNIMLIGKNTTEIPANEPLICQFCRIRASWKAGNIFTCKRHIPNNFELVFEDKIPALADLRKLMTEKEVRDLRREGGKKEQALNILCSRIAFPVIKPKKQKANSLETEELHDAIRAFVSSRWEFFCQADTVVIENQPAFKNPHMKTVQILLFSTLREEFYKKEIRIPPFHLVHAKKKSTGAAKGDSGYSERKAKSEERVNELYKNSIIRGWEETWRSAKKKSDMADAICMCCDFSLKK